MRNKKLLLELSANPDFAPYIEKIRQQRPVIPAWSKEISVDDWVYRSGLQTGFDLAFTFFEGDLNE